MNDRGPETNGPEKHTSLLLPYIIGAGGLCVGGTLLGFHQARKQAIAVERTHFKSKSPLESMAYTGANAGSFRSAAKALAAGTAFCLGGCGLLFYSVGTAMGVRSIFEFADKVKIWAPQKREQLERRFGIQPDNRIEADKLMIASMTYDEEVEHWAQVFERASTEDQPRPQSAPKIKADRQ